jgi:CBS domain-containing protein
MQVKDIMSHPPVTAPIEGTTDVAARLMWEFDCGVVPIVDRVGQLAGMITDRDVCMAAYTQGKPLSAIPVTSAMSHHTVACRINDSIESVERLMRDSQVHRVAVLDSENRLVGIVSLNDLARLAAHAKKSAVDRELVQTLAAVGRPRTLTGVSTNNIVAA